MNLTTSAPPQSKNRKNGANQTRRFYSGPVPTCIHLRQALAESRPRSRKTSMALSHASATTVVPSVGSAASIKDSFVFVTKKKLFIVCVFLLLLSRLQGGKVEG